MDDTLRVLVADARWTVANDTAQTIELMDPLNCIVGIGQDERLKSMW